MYQLTPQIGILFCGDIFLMFSRMPFYSLYEFRSDPFWEIKSVGETDIREFMKIIMSLWEKVQEHRG